MTLVIWAAIKKNVQPKMTLVYVYCIMSFHMSQVRKKTSQITCLERELDEKVTTVTDGVARLADLEGEVEEKKVEVW